MIRPGLALRLAAPVRRYATGSTAANAAEAQEFVGQRQAMKDHAHRGFSAIGCSVHW